mgnify:CR=1 FL=1
MGAKKKKGTKKKAAAKGSTKNVANGEQVDANTTNRATFLKVDDNNGEDVKDKLSKMKEGGPGEEKETAGFTVKRGSNSTVSDDRINDKDTFDAKFNTISEPFKPFVADTSAANFS